MRYQTILASFALLAGLVSALPSVEKYDMAVARRGEPKPDDCVKCPPDEPPPCINCTKGCIYIECNDCDKKEDCCKCLGLEKQKPYFLYYPIPLGSGEPNIRVNPAPGFPGHFFNACSDGRIYDFNAKSNPISFLTSDNDEWILDNGGVPQTFAIGTNDAISLAPNDKTDWFVCNDSGVLTVHNGSKDSQDPSEHCCPIDIFFTSKLQ